MNGDDNFYCSSSLNDISKPNKNDRFAAESTKLFKISLVASLL